MRALVSDRAPAAGRILLHRGRGPDLARSARRRAGPGRPATSISAHAMRARARARASERTHLVIGLSLRGEPPFTRPTGPGPPALSPSHGPGCAKPHPFARLMSERSLSRWGSYGISYLGPISQLPRRCGSPRARSARSDDRSGADRAGARSDAFTSRAHGQRHARVRPLRPRWGHETAAGHLTNSESARDGADPGAHRDDRDERRRCELERLRRACPTTRRGPRRGGASSGACSGPGSGRTKMRISPEIPRGGTAVLKTGGIGLCRRPCFGGVERLPCIPRRRVPGVRPPRRRPRLRHPGAPRRIEVHPRARRLRGARSASLGVVSMRPSSVQRVSFGKSERP